MNTFFKFWAGLLALLALGAAFLGIFRLLVFATACEDPFIRIIQETSSAIRQDAADGDVFLRRAKAYHTLGKLEKAAADYSRAITLGRNEAAVYLARGKCYSDLEQNTVALQDVLHAHELAPPTAGSYHRLADIYTSMANYDEARKAFEKGLALSPTNAGLLTCQARLFLKTRDRKAAARGFDAALAADPAFAFAYFCRGKLHAQQRARAQAIRDFSMVIYAPPTTCYLRRLQLSACLERAQILHKRNQPAFWLDFGRILRAVFRMKLTDLKIRAAEAGWLPMARTAADSDPFSPAAQE